jgi:hypothetical protein
MVITTLLAGLEVLVPYCKQDLNCNASSDDCLYAAPLLPLTDFKEEDQQKLRELGWEYSRGFECWFLIN